MADQATKEMLESWGLPADVIVKFKENDIDFKALQELKEDDISTLFTTLGQRLRFRAGLRSLHPVLQPVVLGVGSDTSSDCTVNEIDLSVIDPGASYLSAISTSFDVIPKLQSTPVKQVDTSASSPLRSSPRIKAKLFKKSFEESQAKHARSITSENLKKILNERVGGKAILNYYEKYGKLNHINQVNLAKYIIDVEWHSSLSDKIETHRFLELRDAIKSLFPTEDTDLYYVPYKNLRNGKKINARGKLYDQYHELRKILIQSGQIRSNRTKRRALNFDTDEENNESQADDEATNIKFEWLTKSSQPLKQAEKYWKDTYSKRIRELEKNNSIATYYTTFPVLKDNCGYTFLISDFSEKFKDYKDTFTAAWPLFKDIFIAYLKSKYTQEYIESLQEFSICLDNKSEHESTVAALRLLALLLPVKKPIKTPNKGLYKPSKHDVVDSIILVVKSDGDLKNAVAERKAHYANLKLSFQPITVVVFNGETVSHSYVIIEETEYLVTSPMVAIDVCFKCIFALNAQYPVESKLAWLYIQTNLYEIETPYDGAYVAVKNFSSAIKDFQKKYEK